MRTKEHWSHKVEFLLAIIGYSVGIGNVWRFPYTCYDSGGGAFLIAYLIMWTLCGVPLLYMEMAIGQFTRMGPVGTLSKICPLFKGTGIGCVVASCISRSLYLVLLVWPFYYLFNSFQYELPWSHCGRPWNTPKCVDYNRIKMISQTVYNKSENATQVISNDNEYVSDNNSVSAASEYFRNQVLQITSGIDNLGNVRWEFALILLLCWLLIYFSIFKGPKLTGKVVYLTVIFPYIILVVLIVRGLTLPGSYEGIMFFLTPKWNRLAEAKVWINAAATNFFSLGIGAGGNVTLASYNKYKGKILKFTIIIAVVDLATSFMAGFAVFSNVGHLAFYQGKEIKDVVSSGTELAFIVFPEIFDTMYLSQLVSALFFLMIITLAIDTVFAGTEIVITAITDRFDSLRREIISAVVCCAFYLLGLPTMTQGAIYYFSLLDYYFIFVAGMALTFTQIVSFAWLYGGRRLAYNISEMTGSAPNTAFVLCWCFLSPCIIVAIWVFSIVQYKPFTFGNYNYPLWALGIAWTISLLPVVCIPAGMVHSIYIAKGSTLFERLMNSIKPKEDHMKSSENVDDSSTIFELSQI